MIHQLKSTRRDRSQHLFQSQYPALCVLLLCGMIGISLSVFGVSPVRASSDNRPDGAVASSRNAIVPGSSSDPQNLGLFAALPTLSSGGFTPQTIGVGQQSMLSFGINNVIGNPAQSGLGFTVTMPSGLSVVGGSETTILCTANVDTSVSSSITVSSAALSSGASLCIIDVKVTSSTASIYGVSASSISNPINLTVNPIGVGLVVNEPSIASMQFSSSAYGTGGPATVDITLNNGTNAPAQSGQGFTVTMPSGLSVIGGSGSTTCSAGSVDTGNSTKAIFSGGGMASATTSCKVTLQVTTNTPGNSTLTDANISNPVNLTVGTFTTTTTFAPPGLTSANFNPSNVGLGQASKLTLVLGAGIVGSAPSGIGFTLTMPTGLSVVSGSGTTCSAGTVDTSDPTKVVFSNGSMSSNCLVTMNVTASAAGSYNITTANFSNPVNLIVNIVGIASSGLNATEGSIASMQFTSTNVGTGVLTPLDITINNGTGNLAQAGLGFTVTLPTGLNAASGSTTCSAGSVDTTDPTKPIFSGGSMASSTASCKVTLQVRSSTAGSYTLTDANIANPINLTVGTFTTTATFFAPTLSSAAFSPSQIGVGQQSKLSFTITNVTGNPAQSGLGFTATMPTGLSVVSGSDSTTCSANSADTSVSSSVTFSGISIGSGTASCTVSVNVTVSSATTYTVSDAKISSPVTLTVSTFSTILSIDSTPPDTTIAAMPVNPTNNPDATFGFTGDDGSGSGVASFECELDSGSFSACTSPQNYPGLADGSHAFQVRAIDAAGNTDPSPAFFTWTIDATPPNTIIDTTPTDPTNSTSASFTFHGDDGTGSGVTDFKCKLDSGSFTPCPSPQSYTGLTDGSHTFQVEAGDLDGNVDASPASFTWKVDTTPPDTTIDTTPTDPTNSTTANFTFHGNDGTGSGVASFQCKLDSGSFAPCPSPQSYTGLTDGLHSFQVEAKDNLGNLDQSPASFNWTVDTTPPDTAIDTTPTDSTNSTSATFTFHGDDSGETGIAAFECNLDGAGFNTCTSPQSYSELAGGSHTFQVRAKDNANNVDASPASFNWTVDITPPDTNITPPTPPSPTSSTGVSLSFSGNDGGGTGIASFECKLDSGNFATCTSPQVYSNLADGAHTFQVYAIDKAGNVDGSPASFNWTVDTTPPDTTITPPTPTNPTTSTSATFSFTGNDGSGSGVASFTCTIDGLAAPCSSQKSYSGLSHGQHTFTVFATDNAGNADLSPDSDVWQIVNAPVANNDTANTAPGTAVDIAVLSNDAVDSSTTKDATSVTLVGGSQTGSGSFTPNGTTGVVTYNPGSTSGTATVKYTFKDALGQTSNQATITANTAPVITTNPTNQTVCAPQSVSFSAASNSNPAASV